MNILKQDILVQQATTVNFVIKLVRPGMILESIMFATTVTKNKVLMCILCLDLVEAINNCLLKICWCTICQHTTKFKQRGWEHVEA